VNLNYEIEGLSSHLPSAIGESKRSLYIEFLMNYTSENTRIGYYKDLRDFNQFLSEQLGIFDDLEVVTNHILAYREYLLKTKELSKRTINRKVSALYAYYQFLWEKEVIGSNPVGKVKRYRVSNKILTNYLDENLVKKYFEMPTNTAKGDQLLERVVLRILFSFGVRNSSVRNLKIKDLIIDDGKYSLKFVIKGGEDIIREIPEILRDELGMYLSWCENKGWDMSEDQYLLRGTRNINSLSRKLSSTTVNNIFRKMISKVGAKGDYSSHTARVNVIVKAEELGDIYVAKEYVAHKSVITTEKYREKGPKSKKVSPNEIVQ
jgi:site-specific recombinase XerD